MNSIAHWLGLGGELANLTGASILALDLLWREKESNRERKLRDLHSWVKEQDLAVDYNHLPVADREFIAKILGQRATKLVHSGWLCLVFGFALLSAYHVLELGK